MHWKNIAGISGLLLFISLTAALSMPTAARNQDKKPSAATTIQKAIETKGIEAAREEFISLRHEFLKAREPLSAVEIFTMAVKEAGAFISFSGIKGNRKNRTDLESGRKRNPFSISPVDHRKPVISPASLRSSFSALRPGS